MATFTAMKRKGKILFKIIFILIVFFNIGIDAYSNFKTHLISIELLTGKSSSESSFNPVIDSLNEDQIDQSYSFDLTEKPDCQLPINWDCFIDHHFNLSIWQPPKIF
jgi:hypothetical protein